MSKFGLSTVLGALLAISSCSAQVALEPGVSVTGAIVAANEVDSYTIRAQAGDMLLIRCARTNGDLKPYLELQSVFGGPIVAVFGPPTLEFTQGVPIGGIYHLTVRDGFTGSATGTYSLCVQIVNRPGHAQALSMGQSVLSPVVPPGGLVSYTLAGSAGDTVLIRGALSSGSLSPRLSLYDPYGNLLYSANSTKCVEICQTLSAPGAYTLFVSDGKDGTNAGSVGLFAQRTNRPDGAIPIEVGATMSGSIDSVAAMRTYRIPAVVGDVILAWIGAVSGTLKPLVRLYDPNGMLISSVALSPYYDLSVAAACAGTYTFIVADCNDGASTGQFNLFVQKPVHPERAVQLSQGVSKAGVVAGPASMKTFTMTIPPTGVSTLSLIMTRTSGTLWPHFHLYDDYGNELSRWYTNNDQLFDTEVVFPGRTYVAIASDGQNGACSGEFTMEWTLGVSDSIRALLISAGLAKANGDDMARLNLVQSGRWGNVIDIRDVIAVTRKAWGL